MNDLHSRLLILQPTPYCNLDCKYCYLPDRTNREQMPPEVVAKAADRLFASGFVKDKVAIVWHSGEPLVVGPEYIAQAIGTVEKVAGKHGYGRDAYQFGVQTNGTLVNPAWVDLFKSYDFRVGVSMDGPEFLHDRQRITRSGRGTFRKALQGLRLIKASGVHLNVICVLTNESLDHPKAIHDFFKDEGVPFVGFNIDEIEGANTKSSFNGSATCSTRFTRFMDKMYDLVESSRAFRVREFDYTQGLILGTQSFAHNEARPFSIISVDYRGGVSTFSPELHGMPSQKYSNFIVGNVLEQSLADMVSSSAFRLLSNDVEHGRARCREECNYYKLCGGGSCSNKFFEHATFDVTESQFCRLSRQAVADVMLQKMESAAVVNG